MGNDPDRQENPQDGWENARENWDRWQEQESKKDWDKWNSSASKSSYYNQPTHPPYDQGFSIASMICGILSVTLGGCYLALPLGAMGILFAVLCRRKRKLPNGNCRLGFYLGILGFVYGVFCLVRAFQQVVLLPAPAFLYLF